MISQYFEVWILLTCEFRCWQTYRRSWTRSGRWGRERRERYSRRRRRPTTWSSTSPRWRRRSWLRNKTGDKALKRSEWRSRCADTEQQNDLQYHFNLLFWKSYALILKYVSIFITAIPIRYLWSLKMEEIGEHWVDFTGVLADKALLNTPYFLNP